MPATKACGQAQMTCYLGNAKSRGWQALNSPHIRLIFPDAYRSEAVGFAAKAEQIYDEYKDRLGTAPQKIGLYYLGSGQWISRIRASGTFKANIIWASPVGKRDSVPLTTPTDVLRYEIANAFQRHLVSPFVRYRRFIHYPPEDIPWQDGLIPFLVHPNQTYGQQPFLRAYRSSKTGHSAFSRRFMNKLNWRVGYSQIQYFRNMDDGWSLPGIYSRRQSFLGLFNYFNFKSAFKQAAGLSYSAFEERWLGSSHATAKADSLHPSKQLSVSRNNLSKDRAQQNSLSDSTVTPYHSLLHTRIKYPIVVPYYANTDNYGLGMYLKFEEPMGIHAFSLSGLFSFPHPADKSYINFRYINNSFRPRLSLRFNHYSSGALFIGDYQKNRALNVLAASSLWKLSAISREKSNWYFGLRLRYMSFQYLPTKTLHNKFTHLFYRNNKTHQTDLKAVITWSGIKLDEDTFIYPGVGSGIQLSATGSEKIMGSDVRYLRLNLGAYTILPAFRKHHLYLYADGVIDIGTPAGRDYLAFANDGSYELTLPKFLGEVNPGYKQFVRGYNTILTGSRFLFGRLEYRIPFEFNTTRKLFGFIPPARTVFTFFSDAGVMGDARLAPNRTETQYRWSAGFEIKRVFSFAGSLQFAYELGLGQPLTILTGPRPYIRIQMAVPF